MKHKHAELIKKWADGAKIQIKSENDEWEDVDPAWIEQFEYRVKPEYNQSKGTRMNDLSKPSQCPRCFGLLDVRKKVWNDRGNIYHLTCWINKTKEDDELRGKTSAYDDELHGKASAYDDELHMKAAAYANNRKDSYCEKMRKKEVEQQTNTQLNWIWVAHYEGYKEGYWTATSNNFFTTDPAKLNEKNT